VGYLCANFSFHRPLCSRLRPDVRDRRQTDRQRDVRQHYRLMHPPRGRGHNNPTNVCEQADCQSTQTCCSKTDHLHTGAGFCANRPWKLIRAACAQPATVMTILQEVVPICQPMTQRACVYHTNQCQWASADLLCPLSHRAVALSGDACLTSVCLTSIAYIGPKSRTDRHSNLHGGSPRYT